jgi:pimeloyl-ACP methyl ester carboxylesterase
VNQLNEAVLANTNIITLADGRSLAYSEFGDKNGRALFFFHGGNDSRLAGQLLDKTASAAGIRLIAPDRPGYGRSDFQPNRQLLDWPDDMAQLADHLQIDRFALMGHSGGGPHVAAVAYKMPERVTGASFVSSAAPPGSSNKGLFFMFRIVNLAMGRSAWLHRKITDNQVNMLLNKPEQMLQGWGMMSKADGRLFTNQPEVVDIILAEMREAIHQGTAAILQEHPLYKRPWGFDISDIRVPSYIWHGAADTQAAPAWSRYLTNHIPGSQLRLVPDEGHFSALVNQQAAILAQV